jgi:hypothetical protein
MCRAAHFLLHNFFNAKKLIIAQSTHRTVSGIEQCLVHNHHQRHFEILFSSAVPRDDFLCAPLVHPRNKVLLDCAGLQVF